MVPVCVYPAGASVMQPPGYYELSGKPHGTHICVPYKPAENTASSRNIAANKSLCSWGGVCPARGFTVMIIHGVVCRGGIYAARRSMAA